MKPSQSGNLRKLRRLKSIGWLGYSRIIVVSHRLPIKIIFKNDSVDFELNSRHKGMVAAVSAMKKESKEVLWIGCVPNIHQLDENQRSTLIQKLTQKNYFPVLCNPETDRLHFAGFCKGVIWPLFHYYGEADVVPFDQNEWRGYSYLNALVAECVDYLYHDGDIILVQDYQLMLVPNMLRKRLPSAQIGFFLQVPWPSCEIYRRLTFRNEILLGLLGADLIAFQSFPYARNFFSCCTRLLGLTIPSNMSGVQMEGQFIKIDVIPTGIDSEYYLNIINSQEFHTTKAKLMKNFIGKKLIVSKDRLEYKSGIILKLKAFESFLKTYPEYRENVVLFQECSLNEDMVSTKQYKKLIEEIEKLIGSINGTYSTLQHTPIVYSRKNHSPEENLAVFSCADAALITPTRDGMNLMSHEFVISQIGKPNPGPIILSEFTGAAQCLRSAILINPWDIPGVVGAIHEALTMAPEEKAIREKYNSDYVRNYTARQWIISLLAETTNTNRHLNIGGHELPEDLILSSFWESNQKLFLLDHEECLAGNTSLDPLVISMLAPLSEDSSNQIYILSGESRSKLEKLFGKLNVGIIAEYGAWFRPIPGLENEEQTCTWHNRNSHFDTSWREPVLTWLQAFQETTPGTVIEEREVVLAIHFPPCNGDTHCSKAKNQLLTYLQGSPKLPVIPIVLHSHAHSSVIILPQEMENSNSNFMKDIITKPFDYDFAFCFANDKIYQDTFVELEKHNIPHVFAATNQKKNTSASYYVKTNQTILKLLSSFVSKPMGEGKSSCNVL